MAQQAKATTPPIVHPSFRERLRRWSKPPRRLTFTRAGKFFMAMTLGVGLGALNTGNNLLFLLLGMMLSAIIASGVLSEAVIRKLHVRRRVPTRIFAKCPAPSSYMLHNKKGYLSLNIEVCEQNPICTAGPLAGQAIGERDIPFWKFWVVDRFEDERYIAIARVPTIAAHTHLEVSSKHIFPARGTYNTQGLRIATRFPFGFFHKVSDVDANMEYIVVPEPIDAKDWTGDVSARFGDIAKQNAGMGPDYFGLRDWREGEDHRQIHWKSSARRGDFVVREFEDQEQRAVHIIVMTHTGMSSPPPEAMKARFELGLSKTVGLLQELQAMQFRTGLSIHGEVYSPDLSHTHLDRMLRALATVQLSSGHSATALPKDAPQNDAMIATIGVGFGRALSQSGVAYDMTLTIDALELQEDANA